MGNYARQVRGDERTAILSEMNSIEIATQPEEILNFLANKIRTNIRRLEGLVMFLSIAENISLADLSSVMRNGAIDYGKERRLAADWIKRLRIKAPGPDAACRKLSGGNQQKVVLARWMTAGSRILVLDHPTRGLDVGAKEEVYELVRDLSDQGVAILLISDTLEETIGLSHQVLVMRDGEITARFDASPGNKPKQVDLLRAMV